jgi:hypothetical protein
MSASVQARLDLLALEGGIARFGTSEPGRAVSVLDVVGNESSMSTADDATQEELLAGRAQFLNAQTGPFQVLVRAEPVDLGSHLRRVQRRAEVLTEPLASVARDYVAFVQGLTHQRTLLERHCCVVLPDYTGTVPAASLGRRVQALLSRRREPEKTDEGFATIPADLGRRLGARCDLVARQLGRSGLRTRRLSSQQLAELLHRCWSPELARVQRLREELGAYTTLVVGSRRQALRQRRRDEHTDYPDDRAAIDARTRQEDERLLSLGGRSLADLIAPASYEIRRDHLVDWHLSAHSDRCCLAATRPKRDGLHQTSPGALAGRGTRASGRG